MCLQIRVKEQKPSGSLYGDAGTPRQPLCTQQERSLQRGCVSSFIEGQERGRAGTYICACQDNGVFFYCFFAVLFPLQKVNHENKSKYFHWHSLFSWTGIYWFAIGDVHLKLLQ